MSGVSSALSALYRLSSIPPWPHLSDFTGTFTSTRLSTLGVAVASCATAAASSSIVGVELLGLAAPAVQVRRAFDPELALGSD